MRLIPTVVCRGTRSFGVLVGVLLFFAAMGPAHAGMVPVGHVDRAPSTSILAYNADGLPSVMTDALNRQVGITYAALPTDLRVLVVTTKVLSVTPNPTTVVHLNADGQPIKVIDARLFVSTVAYNLDGLPTVVTEAVGTTKERSTWYEYDLNGNLKKLIPPKGVLSSVQFEYKRYTRALTLDGTYEGQVTRIQHPDGSQEYFGYDNAGRLEWSTEVGTPSAGGASQSRTIEYRYDELHRPFRTEYPSSPQSIAGFAVETGYDEFGRVKTVLDNTGTSTWTHDVLDRVTQIVPSGGRKTATLSYFIDVPTKAWKVRTQLAGVANFWETLEDTKGRAYQRLNPSNQVFTTEHFADGQPKIQWFPNGTRQEYAYHPRGTLYEIALKQSSGTLLDRFRYTNDPDGRVLTETDLGNRIHGFAYDPLGQLSSETHPDLPTGIQYSYDSHGNRTQVTDDGVIEYYSHDLADKLRWTNTNSNTEPNPGQNKKYNLFEYDGFGQMSRRDRRSTTGGTRKVPQMEWDTQARLRRVREGSNTKFDALYAGDGERISKTDDTTGSHLYSFGLHDTGDGGTVYTPGLSQRRATVTTSRIRQQSDSFD